MKTLSATERTTIVMMNVLTAPTLLCLVAPAHAEIVLYVDANASGPLDDGSTWCSAYTELYEALAVATEGTTIRVADGTYKPDVGSVFNPRDATFGLVNAVRIEGGYAGCGAPDPDERDIDLYETILSGDLNGDDGPNFANNDENVLRVITALGVDETAILDGSTVTGGNADDPSYGLNRGGGMFIESASPTLSNCTFRGNSASANGGGVYVWSSSPTTTGCTFAGNTAGNRGAGMYVGSGDPTLIDCTFVGNSAGSDGGGLYSSGRSTVANCTFTGNSGYNGGGVFNTASAATTVGNCTFSGNSAVRDGGGINGSPTLANCIVSGNSAGSDGGGINGSPTLTNCIVSGNTAESYGGGMYTSGRATLTNCIVSGNSAGSGGGIFTSSITTLSNCTVSGNTAQSYGGGLYSSGRSTVANCTFTGNSGYNGGGVFNTASAATTVGNCTFSGNSAVHDGGGIFSHFSSGALLSNCVLWGNRDMGGRDQSAQIYNPGTVTYTCIEGWTGFGVGNIGRDPLLDDDLRLLPFSPAIDGGDNTAVPPDTLDLDGDGDTSEPTPLDLSGSPRFLDDPLVDDWGSGDPPIVDMGAYESADCDGNGLADWDDIAAGRSDDCNENETPDECEADCNQTGIPDDCDIALGGSPDCNGNHVPDDCDLAEGSSADCNENTVPDDCDIADQTSMDCNDNNIPDDCDIAEGTSQDCNTDGSPDECEPDDDGDGVINDCDKCPDTLPVLIIGDDGCPVPFGPCCFADGPCIDDTEDADCGLVGGGYLGDGLTCGGDPDQDSAYGCDDRCPLDPDKIEPGICGCGVADDDTDRDGVVGCLDSCPDTQAGLPVNGCGCPALGACCFAVAVCWDDVEPDDCAVIEGIYQGDGSACSKGCGFGDFDDSGTVDLRDVAVFQRCFGSRSGEMETSCESGDVDRCGAIDLSDFEAFFRAITGP